MFGIGLFEILVIAVCLLLFFKPHEIPEILRTAGKAFASLKGYANSLKDELEGLGQPKGEVEDLTGKKQPTYDLDDFKAPKKANKPKVKEEGSKVKVAPKKKSPSKAVTSQVQNKKASND